MSSQKFNYKKLSAELEEILERLQSTDLDIDEALEAYEKGMKITKQLEEYLKTAENKIKKINSSE